MEKMMKRYVALAVTALMLVLSGCGQKKEAVEEAAAAAVEETTTAENTEENTVTEENAAEEENTAAEGTEPAEETTASESNGLSEDTVREMLDGGILNWTGLQYFYKDTVSIKTLTAAEAIPMAVQAAVYADEDLEWTEDYSGMIVPKDMVEQYMEAYFGQIYDVSAYEPGEYDMVSFEENKDALMHMGDWGTIVPVYEITDIRQEGNAYTVAVQYAKKNYEEDTVSEPLLLAEYVFVPDEKSPFGFIISDMRAELTDIASES